MFVNISTNQVYVKLFTQNALQFFNKSTSKLFFINSRNYFRVAHN